MQAGAAGMVLGALLCLGAAKAVFQAGFPAGPAPSAKGLTIVEEPGRVVMRWSGSVGPEMLERLDAAFSQRDGDHRDILISLHSGGGNLQQGARVIDLIRKMQRTHTVDTVVDGKSYCASMCVPIFMAGTRRSADRKARFMFHEVSFDRKAREEIELRAKMKQLNVGADMEKKIEKMRIAAATDYFFERYLEPNGVDPKWIADMRKAIPGRDVWRSAEQLVAQGSHIVDAID